MIHTQSVCGNPLALTACGTIGQHQTAYSITSTNVNNSTNNSTDTNVNSSASTDPAQPTPAQAQTTTANTNNRITASTTASKNGVHAAPSADDTLPTSPCHSTSTHQPVLHVESLFVSTTTTHQASGTSHQHHYHNTSAISPAHSMSSAVYGLARAPS